MIERFLFIVLGVIIGVGSIEFYRSITERERPQEFYSFVEDERIWGEYSDFWLVKVSSAAHNDRVDLIFGYGMNNRSNCEELAGHFMEIWSASEFRCDPAN